MEKWKDIKGFEGEYMVSTLGRVKSLDRLVKHKNNHLQFKPGNILKGQEQNGLFPIFNKCGLQDQGSTNNK